MIRVLFIMSLILYGANANADGFWLSDQLRTPASTGFKSGLIFDYSCASNRFPCDKKRSAANNLAAYSDMQIEMAGPHAYKAFRGWSYLGSFISIALIAAAAIKIRKLRHE